MMIDTPAERMEEIIDMIMVDDATENMKEKGDMDAMEILLALGDTESLTLLILPTPKHQKVMVKMMTRVRTHLEGMQGLDDQRKLKSHKQPMTMCV